MTIERSYDLDLLAKLYKELTEDECSDDIKTDEQIYANIKQLINGTDRAYVFKEEGILVGYALVIYDKEPPYLRHFYICRDERRKGYGTIAFNLLIDTLNTKAIDLDVFDWNERGKAFWQSLGFKPRAVIMRREQQC